MVLPALLGPLIGMLSGPLIGLLACKRPSDAERYHRALTQSDSFEQAGQECRAIVDVDSRGDCLVGVMEVWRHLDPQDCLAMTEGVGGRGPPQMALWRDECMFQLAERLRAHGDLEGALVACQETRWARQCAWHLVQDEAEASLDEAPPVAEARIARFEGAQRLPDAALQFWTIRQRAAAARGTRLSEQDCAALVSPAPCQQALRVSVRTMLDARLRADAGATCGPADAPDDTVGFDTAWMSGPIVDALVAEWASERCPAPAAEHPAPR